MLDKWTWIRTQHGCCEATRLTITPLCCPMFHLSLLILRVLISEWETGPRSYFSKPKIKKVTKLIRVYNHDNISEHEQQKREDFTSHDMLSIVTACDRARGQSQLIKAAQS